jgi:polysaccharide pyruvyl transferase WcaK-like protein
VEADAEIGGWLELLNGCVEATVRGPVSVARLADAGFMRAVAVGDLALVHTPRIPPANAGSRDLLVNLSGTEREALLGQCMPESVVIETVARAVRKLVADGWRAVPLVLHRDDVSRLGKLGHEIGGWGGEVVAPSTSAEASETMASVGMVVGMRLHAGVLGWIHGVPTLGLAYRDKTTDFVEQLGITNQVADLRTVTAEELEGAIYETAERPLAVAQRVHEAAHFGSQELKRLLESIDRHLLSP